MEYSPVDWIICESFWLAAGADTDAPSTDPADACEREVRPRRESARVVGRAAGAGLELVLRNDVGPVAACARRRRSLLEGERSGEHERRIDVRYRNLVRIGGDRGQYCRGTSRAVGRATGGHRPAVVELLTEPDDEARLARGIEIQPRLGRDIGLGRIRACEVRCLGCSRIGTVAIAAEPPQDRRPDQSLKLTRVEREELAAADTLVGRRRENNTQSRARCTADPVLDPRSHRVGAVLRARQEAVMTTADLENELRLGGVGEIDQRAGRLVREVDIVRTREQRCLAACLVAAAATIGAADVHPQIALALVLQAAAVIRTSA